MQFINWRAEVTENEEVFDFEGFFRAIDATREARSLNWKQVGSAASVSASTLARMGQGRRPDADGLASLAAWSGINPGDYVRYESRSRPEPLAEISRLLSTDPKLSPGNAAALEDILRTAYARLQHPDPSSKKGSE